MAATCAIVELSPELSLGRGCGCGCPNSAEDFAGAERQQPCTIAQLPGVVWEPNSRVTKSRLTRHVRCPPSRAASAPCTSPCLRDAWLRGWLRDLSPRAAAARRRNRRRAPLERDRGGGRGRARRQPRSGSAGTGAEDGAALAELFRAG